MEELRTEKLTVDIYDTMMILEGRRTAIEEALRTLEDKKIPYEFSRVVGRPVVSGANNCFKALYELGFNFQIIMK